LSDVLLCAGTTVWRELRLNGDCPARRTGHAAAVVGTKVYIFGGKDEQGRLLNDLYILHTSGTRSVRTCRPLTTRSSLTHTRVFACGCVRLRAGPVRWEQVTGRGVAPAGRMDHALSAVGTRLFVHGGLVINDPATRASDLHVFDMGTAFPNIFSIISNANILPVTQTWREVDVQKELGIALGPLGRYATGKECPHFALWSELPLIAVWLMTLQPCGSRPSLRGANNSNKTPPRLSTPVRYDAQFFTTFAA